MTELGVYILGAMALGTLAAAGVSTGNHNVLFCAVTASGAAYLSQLGASAAANGVGGNVSVTINAVFMLIALVAWAFGVLQLI